MARKYGKKKENENTNNNNRKFRKKELIGRDIRKICQLTWVAQENFEWIPYKVMPSNKMKNTVDATVNETDEMWKNRFLWRLGCSADRT